MDLTKPPILEELEDKVDFLRLPAELVNTACHEAGHATTAFGTKSCHSLDEVSIVAKYFKSNLAGKFLSTGQTIVRWSTYEPSYAWDRLVNLMAGMAGEEIGSSWVNPANSSTDFHLARWLLANHRQQMHAFSRMNVLQALRADSPTSKLLAGSFSGMDLELTSLAFHEAAQTIVARRHSFDQIVKTLLKQQTIYKDQLGSILSVDVPATSRLKSLLGRFFKPNYRS